MERLEKTVLATTGTGTTTYTLTESGRYFSILNYSNTDITIEINSDGKPITVPGVGIYDGDRYRIMSVKVTATSQKYYLVVEA